MSLGDSRSSAENKNKIYEKQYSSRFSVRDYQHNTNKVLNYSYKNGMLIISIDKIKDGGFEYETIVDAWITPTKAKLLLQAIKDFKEAKKLPANAGFGIASGMGETQRAFILRSDENGNPMVTIGKFNGNNGEWIVVEDFRFNNDNFHFYLNWEDYKNNGSASSTYYNNIEFEQLEQIVSNFANNMDGAIAYSTVDMLKFDFRGILNKINPIYDKLGIERQFSGRTTSTGSFFGGSNQRNFGTSESKSLDEISSRFEDDDDE